MRRYTKGFVLGMAWLIAGATAASAAGDMGTLAAPYSGTYEIGAFAIAKPCTSRAGPFVGPTAPEPTSGRIALAETLAASDCATLRAARVSGWKLGSVPPSLVGKPGKVSLLIRIKAIRLVGTIAYGTASASVTARVLDHTWTLASVTCSGTTCAFADRRKRGMVTLSAVFDRLPATLEAAFGASAELSDATASIGAGFDGVLTWVRVRGISSS